MVTFFAPFLGLLGGSWGAPGALLAAPGAVLAPLGPLLAPPGALLGGILASRGAPFGAFWVSFYARVENSENLGNPCFFNGF